MDVSVIIVNYNTKELTKNCIDSIFEKTSGVTFEVILVDNASTDGSVEVFVQDNRIFFIQNNRNLGFGLANNEGNKIAQGKYVFFLNPDTLLLNNAIKILYDFMECHSHAGICGGNLFDSELNPIHSYRMMLPSFAWEMDYHLGQMFTRIRWGKNAEYNDSEAPMKVGYITGADMMIRKEIFDKVGGFSKYFFMYYEECELTYRINELGFNSYSVPSAKIQHLEGKSFPSTDFTTKDRFLLSGKWIYRRLCFCPIIYKLLCIMTRIKLCFQKEDERKLYLQEVLEYIGNIQIR